MVIVNMVVHRPEQNTYTNRSISHVLGHDASTTVILIVWFCPLPRLSFLQRRIGTSWSVA